MDAPPVLRRWISERHTSLEQIALQGTWLDREDVNRLLSLSLPGIDEIAALLEISRLARSNRYDTIVVDTAPTGHTLRMLSMPETLFGIARVFDQMRLKHRAMVEALRGSWVPEQEDALIDEVAGEARSLAGMLRDTGRTRISWVTLAEPMAIAETADALADLRRREMAIREVVVNRLTPRRRANCAYCQARRAFESAALRQADFGVPMVGVFASDEEPRGLSALRRIAAQLESGAALAAFSGSSEGPRQRFGGVHVLSDTVPLETLSAVQDLAASPTLKLLLFGGKGGVGKTTCATAAAIDIAARQPERRIVLISTDPAHSVADVLGTPLSDTAKPVKGAPPNLAVRELDPAVIFDQVRSRYAAAIDGMFDRLGAGRSFDASHDRAVLHALIDLAPPGLDELAATIEIAEAVTVNRPRWDLAVIDTAPTGHALRLLELPSLIHDWTKALMAILLKYQPVIGLGELGSLLLQLSRGLAALRELLADALRTRFVVVTRAAALPRAESIRLLERLDALRVQVPAVIVNAVGRGTCKACRTATAAEQREIARLRRGVAKAPSGRQLVLAASEVPPPHGPAALKRWRRTAWRAASAASARRASEAGRGAL